MKMPKKINKLPSAEMLRGLLSYSPESGQLTWRLNGAVAGTRLRVRDLEYISVSVKKRKYLAHRLIFKMMTGVDPVALVDHRDGDGTNNRWVNLRDANDAENICNSKIGKANRSGVKGVSFDTQTGRWRATLTVDYKARTFGRFDSIGEAEKAIVDARLKLHGAFARAA